ncbi:MAG TPA: hypothetical protein PKC98_18650, partial [Candidatus Melainabacteria bacterium]|nr:hypothetical protein [Candidatus Melainabacteria bacterium]
NHEYPRLGELLVAAGIVSYEDSLVVAELGTENDINYGNLLIQNRLASIIDIDAALLVQKMFTANTERFTMRRAVRLIKMAHAMQEPLENLLLELDVLEQVIKLLRDAELIDEGVIRSVAAEIVDFEQTLAEALVTRGVVTPRQSKAGLDCLKQIEARKLSYEHALVLLGKHRRELQGQETAQRPAARAGLVAA